MTQQNPPTFLYIGISKAGSTWIFEALREHPQIFVPHVKDIRYFEDEFYNPQAYDRYCQYFAPAGSAQARGELSHNYILSATCAERIQYHLPHAKLLVCLREPGDWVTSTYRYMRMFRPEAQAGFEHFWAHVLRERGVLNYYENLKAYYERFDSSQINVMFYEDLRADASRFAADLYRFLAVDPAFQPRVIDQHVNAARSSRFGNRVTQLLNVISQTLRRMGLANVVGTLKHNALMNKLFFSSTTPAIDIAPATVQAIRTATAHQYTQLETLIGRDLPAVWYDHLADRAGEGQAHAS